MPLRLRPADVQENVHKGFERLSKLRKARIMFLEEYVGPYYGNKTMGNKDEHPLNLIYNAIRTLVPHIVMNFPKHKVYTQFKPAADYAKLLSLALDNLGRKNDLKFVYRRAITDALFTLGIVKVGLAESDSVYSFDDYDDIDPGQIYAECVDFDNFVADPDSRDHLFRDAKYIGDRMCIPRQVLLDSGLYNNELVERLPSLDELRQDKKAEDLSRPNSITGYDIEDEVEIVELWVPSANAMVTVPATKDVTFEDYLRVDDYYGPDSGPYSFLALTPPVPNNPIPIPPVGIWYDMHRLANKMAQKTIQQAIRQKDILLYRPDHADDAESVKEAADGEAIAVQDPTAINSVSLGGQNQKNELMTAQAQAWFNMLAANPQGIGGQNLDADSATEAQILQQNANVGLKDMEDMVYQFGGEVASKMAWYLHTDPLIQMPLIKRQYKPAQYAMSAQGPVMTSPPETEEVQVELTPEARAGSWLDFTFDIQAESMGKMDSKQRLAVAMDFATRAMPAVLQAAQAASLVGIPFNAQSFLIMLARDAGIDWLDHVFDDPDFHAKHLQMMAQGPDPEQSKGQVQGAQMPGGGMLAALMQNGQPGQVQGQSPPEGTQRRQQSQEGANQSQSDQKLYGGPMI